MKNTKREILARKLADKAFEIFPIGLVGPSVRKEKVKAIKPSDRMNPSRAIKP